MSTDSAAALMASLARPTVLRPGEMTLDLRIGAMNPVMRFEVYFSSRYQVTFELNENNTASRLWVFVSTSDPCPTEETAMWSCKEPVTRKRIVIHPVDDRFVEGPCYVVVRYTGTSGSVYFSMLTSVKENFSSRWDFPASTYEGDWHLNHRHGNGKCVYYFQNGLRLPTLDEIADANEVPQNNEEARVLALPAYDGVFEAYSGEWRGGLKDGRGVYQWRNKCYVGDWQDGKRNGQGILVLEDGTRYDGSWRDDKKNGYGVQHYANGTCYIGDWVDNKRSGEKGIFKYANGVEIKGTWVDDILLPQVEAVYPPSASGARAAKYSGEWQNDARHGTGSFRDEAGFCYEGEWVDDKRHGRGVWKLHRGVRFEGEWDDDVRLEDRGEFKFPNGDVYEGEWDSQRHLREGRGTCQFANGDRYDGEWADDTMAGNGTMSYADEYDTTYTGEWEGGERHGQGECQTSQWVYVGGYSRNQRSGQGVCKYANNGIEYDGEWLDDQRHGRGVYTLEGGATVYTGAFEAGKISGYGEVSSQDGTVYKGEWRDGKRHGAGTLISADGTQFEGNFQGGNRVDGIGKIRYANGDVYEGPFKNELRHGHEGRCTYSDGTMYEGSWENDKRHGQGSFHNQDGDVYTGEWEGDMRLDGEGTCVYADGRTYSGGWRDGLPHGMGHLIYPNQGEMGFQGNFVNGVFKY